MPMHPLAMCPEEVQNLIQVFLLVIYNLCQLECEKNIGLAFLQKNMFEDSKFEMFPVSPQNFGMFKALKCKKKGHVDTFRLQLPIDKVVGLGATSKEFETGSDCPSCSSRP